MHLLKGMSVDLVIVSNRLRIFSVILLMASILIMLFPGIVLAGITGQLEVNSQPAELIHAEKNESEVTTQEPFDPTIIIGLAVAGGFPIVVFVGFITLTRLSEVREINEQAISPIVNPIEPEVISLPSNEVMPGNKNVSRKVQLD